MNDCSRVCWRKRSFMARALHAVQLHAPSDVDMAAGRTGTQYRSLDLRQIRLDHVHLGRGPARSSPLPSFYDAPGIEILHSLLGEVGQALVDIGLERGKLV